ncbi:MAG: intracellular growth attenuator family protein [Bacilli bacterium]|nr:intracellular growth attenuator family protein [Bacilli bacterium]
MNFNYSNYFNFYEAINNKGTISIVAHGLTYTIGFEDIFKALSNETKDLLDNIYEYAKNFNSGFIDNRVWLYYLTTSKIVLPPIKEQFITNDNYDDIHIKVGRNGKGINLNLYKDEFLDNQITKSKDKPLFPINKKDKVKSLLHLQENFYIVNKKTVYFNTEIELLLSFMNCLFSTRRKFYIKKCDLCDKYYVADKSDTHYCGRVKIYDNKELTCSEIAAKMQKNYNYKSKVESINREFLKKINDMPDGTKKENYKNRYKKERDLEKIKYLKTGDLNILIDFINNYESIHPFPDYDK